jgi:hypothetical protein
MRLRTTTDAPAESQINMLLARTRIADGIELLKQNHSELLRTMEDLVDDWVRTYAPRCNSYWRWRIRRHQMSLHKALGVALRELAHLAEPQPDAPARAEFMGYRYPCLQNTEECWRALRGVQIVVSRFPAHPCIKVISDVLAQVVNSFDVSRPVELKDWPTAADLIADYMGMLP